MKKVIKIILCNIIGLIIIISVVNFLLFYMECKNFDKNIPMNTICQKYKEFMTRDISIENSKQMLITSDEFRPIENKESKKAPIVLFGCSFAYGASLKEDQTLSYKLGKKTGRPIYNRGLSGLGVQHMLFQLRDKSFYQIVPKPEYVIYLFMEGHIQRITTPTTPSFPNCYTAFYKNSQMGDFVLKKRTFLSDKIIIQHHISNYLAWNFLNRIKSYNEKWEKNFVKYVVESKKEVEKNWPSNGETETKFVVIFYRGEPILNSTIDTLNEKGIIVITKDDFNINVYDKKYQISETDTHPSELAWDIFTPIIIEKLNL